MSSGRIVIPGGSGFLGSYLAGWFTLRGYEVVTLSRSKQPNTRTARAVQWDGVNPGDWTREL